MNLHPGQVKCSYDDGMFANEYAVEIQLLNGEKISIFADRGLVRTNGEQRTGYLTVEVVGESGDASTVLLPSEALETGSRWAQVPKSQLEYRNGSQQYGNPLVH